MKKRFWAMKIIGFIFLGALAILGFGYIVMALWNAILPAVLHVSAVTFPQALGILVLSKILFGGFRGRGGWGGRRHRWKEDIMNKWQAMNPEEREKWKQDMRNRCRSWNHGFGSKKEQNYTGEAGTE